MTTGQKIKEIRNRLGLSQEDLASKLNVSRQAITKWESDTGLPDTDNLIQLSNLFGITIDYFLNKNIELPLLVMREKFNLNDLYKKTYKDKFEAILKTRFPEPWIITVLVRKKKMNKLEAIFDFFIGAGTLDLGDAISDMSPYYLVSRNNIQFIVNIKKDYIIAKEINNENNKKIVIEKNIFIKTNIKL